MKILFINPSIIGENVGHYSKQIEKQRGIYPPLGICYVAASLLKHGHEVKIIDCDTEEDYLKTIVDTCNNFKPDMVGLYSFTWTFRRVVSLANKIKELLPSAILVIGGPNVCSFPKLSVELGPFDYGVRGEGEETIIELMELIESKKGPSEVKSLIWRDGNQITMNPFRDLIDNLDRVPLPARHLLKMDKYFDVFTQEKKFTTIFASRGCPFNCLFCDRENRMGRAWRVHSAERVIHEIVELQKNYGIREFMFFDDNFVINKDWVRQFCQKIKDKKLDILWEIRTRVDMVDEDILKIMKDAGCYRIRFGFEHGDDRILKVVKKGITVEQSLECARLCKKVGIEMFGYFMVGAPEETMETMQKTLNLALKIEPDFAIFSKTILIPGSELFEWAVAHNYIKPDYWEKFLRGEITNPAPALSTKELPQPVVDKFVKKCNKTFYFRSSYVLRRILSLKSLPQLIRQVKMAKALLG